MSGTFNIYFNAEWWNYSFTEIDASNTNINYTQCYYFWYMVFAHELAHNHHRDHGEAHNWAT